MEQDLSCNFHSHLSMGCCDFFHAYDQIMSVVTYHMNAFSYVDSQKWVTGASDDVLITEKMSVNEGK